MRCLSGDPQKASFGCHRGRRSSSGNRVTRQGSIRYVPCKRCDGSTDPVVPMASLGSTLFFLGWINETSGRRATWTAACRYESYCWVARYVSCRCC